MRVAILRDSKPESSAKWELACQKACVTYHVIDMLRDDWLQKLEGFAPDFCVSRPPGDIQKHKDIFDEKLFFIEKYTKYSVFPGFLATFIYENKSALSWFLQINNILHAKTFVSSSLSETLEYVKNAQLPIVAKTLIGAAGSGVKIFSSRKAAVNYVNLAFSSGIKRRFGPNRKVGTPASWLKKAFRSPGYFFKKLSQYRERDRDVQYGIVLFQEYIQHDYEWRCVKIGDSYFAYKKLKIDDQASGSKQFEYGPPPLELLDFTKDLCDRFDFLFMTVDLFYSGGKIYVNELQTIFGHKNPFICKVNDHPGRYLFNVDKWVFEAGDFNTNESYDLRLESAIKKYESKIN
jgi:glutathione synthase/RimK-type ligase-like ATP-grasp enzyme